MIELVHKKRKEDNRWNINLLSKEENISLTKKTWITLNDEENPIKNINLDKVLEIMANSDEVDFAKEYFDMPCGECKEGVSEKKKFFAFLGYNFYIYTKNGEFVISSIDKEYEGLSFRGYKKQEKQIIAIQYQLMYVSTVEKGFDT